MNCLKFVKIIFFSCLLLSLFNLYGCTQRFPSLKPNGLPKHNYIRLSRANLEVVFVDNTAFDKDHLPGYNGIAELRHSAQDSTIFVPAYAGFNLEHIFGGDSLEQRFEPRKHPMSLYRKSDNEVWLYQSPTPLSRVESLTQFRIIEPQYIDIIFKCKIHAKEFFNHDYAGFFWASYIFSPTDKKIYFLGRRKDTHIYKWIAAYSEKHGSKSTHLWENDPNNIFFAPNFDATLASNFSDYMYKQPFYFGRFHNMVLVYMFDRSEGIRFSQSPTGGGINNPAWDFQFILPNFQIGTEYSFRSRIVYKKFNNKDDILYEYQLWKNFLKKI